MIILEESEAQRAWSYIKAAEDLARTKSKCIRSQNGILLVRGGIDVIGRGYNSPPSEILCTSCLRESFRDRPSTTEPCLAIHAEERAVIDAFQKGNKNLDGTVMYHARIRSGKLETRNIPSCMQCSKRNELLGISFVMITRDGIAMYDPEEFNRLTREYVLSQSGKGKFAANFK
jgi:deoxycytidylate deaminase